MKPTLLLLAPGCFAWLLLAALAGCGSHAACDPTKSEPGTDCEKGCDTSKDLPGSACEIEGQVCGYGDGECFYRGVCEKGVWKGTTECVGFGGAGGANGADAGGG